METISWRRFYWIKVKETWKKISCISSDPVISLGTRSFYLGVLPQVQCTNTGWVNKIHNILTNRHWRAFFPSRVIQSKWRSFTGLRTTWSVVRFCSSIGAFAWKTTSTENTQQSRCFRMIAFHGSARRGDRMFDRTSTAYRHHFLCSVRVTPGGMLKLEMSSKANEMRAKPT